VLGQTTEGLAIRGKEGALNAWRRAVGRLSDLSFPDTASSLALALRRVMRELKLRPPSSKVDANSSHKIQTAMLGAWQRLEGEAQHRFTVMPGPTKMKEEHLLTNPAALFHEGVFAGLPELAQQDFAEAAQCLAFSLCTAGACLIVRASECALRQFYCACAQSCTPRKNWPGWNTLVKALKNRRTRKPSDALLAGLFYVGTHLRNPTQHPDLRHDDESAHTLFTLCIEAVNHMAKETKRISGC